MKKLCFALILALISSISFAQEPSSFDITSPLSLWLLNNEAKAMTELGKDGVLLSKNSMPFSILPNFTPLPVAAENKLWEIHRNIYTFLDEVQAIYDISQRFGNGKFSVNLKRARPETWGYSAIATQGFSFPKSFINETRKAYLDNLFVTIGLDAKRDRDLSSRLKAAIRSLTDEEFRLTKEYISAFKALYPRERSVVTLELFLNQGTRKQFATGLTEIIKSLENLAAVDSNSDSDSLADLEALTKSKGEEEAKPISQMEAPDPDASGLYDIW